MVVRNHSKNRLALSKFAEENRTLVSISLLAVVGILLGLTTINSKLAFLVGWNPIAFMATTSTAGGMLMLFGALLFKVQLSFSKKIAFYSFGSGLLFAVPNLIFFYVIVEVGAGFVALVTAFVSILTYIFMVLLRAERLSLARALGVVVALVGTLVLSFGKLSDGELAPYWVALTLVAPFFLAIGNIYRSWFWPKGASPFALAPQMLIVAGLISFAIVPFFDAKLDYTGAQTLLPTFAAQVGLFAIGFAFYFTLQKFAGAVYLSQIGPIIALVGTVLGIVVLGEALTTSLLVGGFAIVAGVVIFNIAKRN